MIASLLVINFFALASPGADFFYFISHALRNEKKQAILAALGIALGVMVWAALTLLGLGKLIQQITFLRVFFPLAGAAYLLYLSYTLFKHRDNHQDNAITEKNDKKSSSAFFGGLMINLSNPKVFFYFTSIFTSLLASQDGIDNITAFIIVVCLGIESLLWFIFAALIFTSNQMQNLYNQYICQINTCIALAFSIFACLVITSLVLSV